MKRSAPVVWTLLAVCSVGLLLLVGPFAWFGEERGPEPFAPSTPVPDGTARNTGIADAPVTTPGETIERQTVDRLVEAGIVCFRVVVPAGRPVVGAQVIVVRNEQLLCNEHTDARGEIELAADGRPAGLVIAAKHRPLEWRDVVLNLGRQEVLLADRGRVSVRFMREDGASPGQLRLTVEADHPLSSNARVPLVVEKAISVRTLRGYDTLKTDEEGEFECTGLPESWSGRLWLRGGWKVASTSHGDILPFARGIRLTEPTSDTVVRIAPHEILHGRLILRHDGSPLGGARLSTMLRSRDVESPTFSSAVTDEAGHFEVRVRQEQVSGLDLRLGERFHHSPSILVLDGTDVPADGDLGDVLVDGVRHVPFQLQDTSGKPIVHGVATAAGTRSAPTRKNGLGELRWLARSATRMAVEAPGFVPTEREIPSIVVDPLVVTMKPANELVVSLGLPAGADPGQFKVVLRGEERITAVPITDRLGQRRHVSEWAYPLVKYAQAALDTYLCARPDALESSVTFHALRPGVEIELRVHGITGDMVYHSESLAPFAPAEHRKIEVPLKDRMIVFRGRVLNQDGTPLVRASLQLTGQILGWTNKEGAFLCFLATPDTGTLIIQHRACTTKYLHNYAVPTHGRPVDFRLNAARHVTIEVVDKNGAPVPQAEVWTKYGGFTTNTHRIEGHRHLASSVPEAPFDIVARLAGREYRQNHDPALHNARIVVPVHGRVVALVAEATTAGRTGQFILILAPPQREKALPLSAHRNSSPSLRIEIPAVHPGAYEASLRYVPSKKEREAGRKENSSKPVPVVIEAGRETEIRLALPAGGD